MIDRIKGFIKPYTICPLLAVLGFNCLVYWAAMALAENRAAYDLTTAFDRAVPFLPWTVSVYLVCYLFWGINYLLVGHLSKKEFYQFVTAELGCKMICFLIFVAMPTTNVRPEITGNGIWDQIMRWLYHADQPLNLFPSIHCLVSWFCYIPIRGDERIPRRYRIFSCVFALMVCVSTQTTKQHYIADLVAGILLAEAGLFVSRHTRMWEITQRFFERIRPEGENNASGEPSAQRKE